MVKRKSIMLSIITLLLVASFMIPGCATTSPATTTPAPSQEALPEVVIKFPTFHSSEDVDIGRFISWIDEWFNGATGGRTTLEPYWGDTLIVWKDAYRALQEGIADFTWVIPSFTPGVFPLHDLFMLPGLFPVQMLSMPVVLDLYREYPQFEAEFGDKVETIGTHVLMSSDLHSRMPIRSLADLKGKMILCQNESSAEALQLLGASTSVTPITDMYTTLERGVGDGCVVAWGSMSSWKLYEVAPYHSIVGISPVMFIYTFNKDTFNKFTPQEQTNLKMLWPWMSYGISFKNITNLLAQENTYLLEEPQELIYWSPEDLQAMQDLFVPLHEKWIVEMEAKGYPGREIYDRAKELIATYSRG